MLRIGADIGGTNTDVVVMLDRKVLSAVKRPTSENITDGVRQGIDEAIDGAAVAHADIAHVMIGTTQFTNAVIERKSLSRVSAIRLGLPATACLPPMVDWPGDIRRAVGGTGHMVRGGYEFDGREHCALDLSEIDALGGRLAADGAEAVAITGVFAPVDGTMEMAVRERLAAALPGIGITLSCEVGRLGLLERENATILNAALLGLASRTIDRFERAIAEAGLACGFSISQNDGTLMAAADARRFPVLTFASGPTNSMRGAAFLTGATEAIVLDIGGTTSDVGALRRGFPRQASASVDIGGVRTNFRMPDVIATGLGGGSLVRDGGRAVGPDSVGFRIAREAVVFGGTTLTATDIAVRNGRGRVGDPSKVAAIPHDVAARAGATIDAMLDRAVDRMRISSDPLKVIAVGGGAMLAPDRIAGLEVVRPDHGNVANAIGAAIAQVSGEVERVVSLDRTTRAEALCAAEAAARLRAVASGARETTIEVLERDAQVLSYMPGNAAKIRVRVAGELAGPR